MKLHINGDPYEAESPLTLAELLHQLNYEMTGIALAVNQTIIAQQEWSSVHLQDGDQVALFRAIAGG